MYGTIGRFLIKAGMEGQFRQLIARQAPAFETGQIAGFVASYGYRMDADPNDYYLAVVFESRESYSANAQSPEQEARYRQWLPLLEGEPEWHDGEIDAVYAPQKPG
jgi:quinol monooxygenase YgiN